MAAPTLRTVESYSTHQVYSIDFFGNELIVTVTPTASVISRWIRNVQSLNRRQYYSHPLVVGVGVQWTPVTYHSNPSRNSCYSDPPPLGSYYADPHNYYADPSLGSYNDDLPSNSYRSNHPPDSYYVDSLPDDNNNYSPPSNYYADPPPRSYFVDSPPDILQLCVGKRCLVIQLSHCDRVPDDLRYFLTDPETTYVGVWNSQDAGKLERSRHQLEIGKLVDIRNYVYDSEGWGMRSCSFEKIVEECMGYQGVRLDPEISRSDWSVYNLCDEQILQVSLDAYVCFELGVWVRIWEV